LIRVIFGRKNIYPFRIGATLITLVLINGSEKSFFRNDFYESYYDKSHFIKDFKRFTGLPPIKFEKQANSFGESYYRE